ncbi:MAG: GDP-mannose 4,6-dehydratase [Planctomycetes bacterium]|nr:GDP-mannose 4,6-dehydratase [Planctomycetota bacterium]MCW8136045.1 GDP-mannose 4,6-dehydratase [Planctomycetota bacterium]
MPTAFITGITGQDGSYLAELLLSKGYTVYGLIRRSSTFNTARISHLYQDPHDADYRLRLVYGDMTDGARLHALLAEIKPDEIYNLAAQAHVKVSFETPESTGDIDALGVTRLLESVREVCPKARFYQAGSSEMFGSSPAPQNEDTPMLPRSPYAIAKLYAHHMTRNYREAYGMYAVSGILFNHESPRRGATFVTRKITRAVAAIKAGAQDKLYLGNLDARRDWGFAPEYVEGMWRMLQAATPRDYVLATGEVHSVREFAQRAFARAGLDWQKHIEIDPRYLRPTEVDVLQGDAARAEHDLDWKAATRFEQLVDLMVDADLHAQQHGRGEFEAVGRHF